MRERPSETDTREWFDAVAALPVLGNWLGESTAALELERIIREWEPWNKDTAEQRRARVGYRRAAEPHARALKRAMVDEGMYRFLSPSHNSDAEEVNFCLNALIERIPMFDQVPRKSKYTAYSLMQLLVRLFRFDPSNRVKEGWRF